MSYSVVSITITLTFCSHTICQRSATVSWRGPWVAMYLG